jgi:hypothetical protein
VDVTHLPPKQKKYVANIQMLVMTSYASQPHFNGSIKQKSENTGCDKKTPKQNKITSSHAHFVTVAKVKFSATGS